MLSRLLDQLESHDLRQIVLFARWLVLRAALRSTGRKLIPIVLLGLISAFALISLGLFAIAVSTGHPLLIAAGIEMLAGAYVVAWFFNRWLEWLKRPAFE